MDYRIDMCRVALLTVRAPDRPPPRRLHRCRVNWPTSLPPALIVITGISSSAFIASDR
eukprot:COSAG06_NODE_47339_length_340_cov_0.477178_1_plen_57_part_01